MRRFAILAAAAGLATVIGVAGQAGTAHAMMQCGGNDMLTMNPDGTTTCGTEEWDGNLYRVTDTSGAVSEVEILELEEGEIPAGGKLVVNVGGVRYESEPADGPQRIRIVVGYILAREIARAIFQRQMQLDVEAEVQEESMQSSDGSSMSSNRGRVRVRFRW